MNQKPGAAYLKSGKKKGGAQSKKQPAAEHAAAALRDIDLEDKKRHFKQDEL